MDNFNQIKSLLKYNREGDFYFIQLFKRKKDNPSMNKHEKLIKSYSVFSLEEYDNLEGDIGYQCEVNNARAYIRLNVRNSKDIALRMIKDISDKLLSNQTNSLYKIYDSIVGQYNSDEQKTWLVDVDGTEYLLNKVVDKLSQLSIVPITTIQTINGYHLIVKPFDNRIFKSEFPTIDIHKDNPTLLYYEPILKEFKEGREDII